MADTSQGLGWWQANDGKWYAPAGPLPPPPKPSHRFAPPTATRLVAPFVIIAGGLAMVAGSFLPWVTATAPLVGTTSRSGVDGGSDGLITAAIGTALALIGLHAAISSPRPLSRVGGGLLGAAGVVFFLFEYRAVQDRIDSVSSEFASGTHGSGLFLIAGGALLAVVASLILQPKR